MHNHKMRAIQVSASATSLPPQAKLFPSALGIQTKGYQHWNRGVGEGGALGLFLSTGRGVLRRGEFSIQRLNLFATACSLIATCTSNKDKAFFFKPNADTDKVSIIMNFMCRLCLALRYEFVDNVHKSNQINSYQTCRLVFEKREKRSTGRKTSRSWVENQQTRSTCDATSGNRNRATLVGRESALHYCVRKRRVYI